MAEIIPAARRPREAKKTGKSIPAAEKIEKIEKLEEVGGIDEAMLVAKK